MRAAQLKDNVVENYAEVIGFGPIGGVLFVDPKDSDIGDVWDPETGNFSKPTPVEE